MKEYRGEEQQKIIDKNVKGIHEYNKKHPIHMKSTPRSKALKGEKSKSWMDSGLTGTFDRKSAERRIKKTGSVL